MPALWTQTFPPRPKFTDKELGPQQGKVFVVTGGASGIGFELASILYHADATVYIAGRSKAKALEAIASIRRINNSSKGRIEFLYLDLSDLSTIKPAAEAFKARETKIDVLWNNAGIGSDTGNVKSVQGTEIHYATNCTGPLLFTRLLREQLEAADGTARVVWYGSLTIDLAAPSGGLDLANLETPSENSAKVYAGSKTGNWFIASELAKEEAARAKRDNRPIKVIHLVLNPGNLRTPIWRYAPWLFVKFVNYTVLYPPKYGAYTGLWAGLSEDIRPEDTGRYIVPWGRWHPQPRKDILASLQSEGEGGTGLAARFVEWCENKYEGFT